MSNVIKLASEKEAGHREWQAQIEEHADKLMDRLYDRSGWRMRRWATRISQRSMPTAQY